MPKGLRLQTGRLTPFGQRCWRPGAKHLASSIRGSQDPRALRAGRFAIARLHIITGALRARYHSPSRLRNFVAGRFGFFDLRPSWLAFRGLMRQLSLVSQRFLWPADAIWALRHAAAPSSFGRRIRL